MTLRIFLNHDILILYQVFSLHCFLALDFIGFPGKPLAQKNQLK